MYLDTGRSGNQGMANGWVGHLVTVSLAQHNKSLTGNTPDWIKGGGKPCCRTERRYETVCRVWVCGCWFTVGAR